MKSKIVRSPFKTPYSVRISQDAKEKLDTIAQQKNKTLSFVASNIILYYARGGYDYEQPSQVKFTTIQTMIASMNVSIGKMVGSTERTEYFIKTLLREERDPQSFEAQNDHSEGENIEIQPLDHKAKQLLGQLISQAQSAKNFDGKSCMAIKLSMTEFETIKAQYDQLCM